MVMRFEAHLECLPGSTQVRQHHGLDAGEEKEASPGRTQATVVRQSLKVQLKVASSQLWMVENGQIKQQVSHRPTSLPLS